jgi:4-hydroxythreonine-4-phosphate dehydrogenase
MTARSPLIAITMGDPGGIGAEVVVKALAEKGVRSGFRFFVYGEAGAMYAAAERAGIEPFWWQVPFGSRAAGPADGVFLLDHGSSEPEAGPTRESGEASFRFLEHAIADTLRAKGDPLRPWAIVTAPISKEAWALAGHAEFPGHTELLAARYNTKRVRMMFVAPGTPGLRVMLATTHVPLSKVPGLLTVGRVSETIDLAQESCVRLGVERPRIAVCGVNPHAGEAGLLGDDEERVIAPAIRLAQGRGIGASGPFPGDTIFNAALKGRYDIVIAMYHDQGLIPVKLLAFDRAVNYSAGLPVVRTSPDHGTAFDIAGKNLADAGSMKAAIELAGRLVMR